MAVSLAMFGFDYRTCPFAGGWQREMKHRNGFGVLRCDSCLWMADPVLGQRSRRLLWTSSTVETLRKALFADVRTIRIVQARTGGGTVRPSSNRAAPSCGRSARRDGSRSRPERRRDPRAGRGRRGPIVLSAETMAVDRPRSSFGSMEAVLPRAVVSPELSMDLGFASWQLGCIADSTHHYRQRARLASVTSRSTGDAAGTRMVVRLDPLPELYDACGS